MLEEIKEPVAWTEMPDPPADTIFGECQG